MSLYAIGDLHLGFQSDKSMEVFGEEWTNHSDKINETAFLSSVHRAILPLPILSYPVSAVNSRAYIPEQHTLLHHFIICNWLTLQAPIALRLCLTTDLLLHAYYTAIHEKYKCPTGFFRSRLSAPRLPVHSFSNGHSLLT